MVPCIRSAAGCVTISSGKQGKGREGKGRDGKEREANQGWRVEGAGWKGREGKGREPTYECLMWTTIHSM